MRGSKIYQDLDIVCMRSNHNIDLLRDGIMILTKEIEVEAGEILSTCA